MTAAQYGQFRVEQFLHSMGWKIQWKDLIACYGPDEEFTDCGLIYATETILLNTQAQWNNEKLLLALLHETGHVIAHLRGYQDTGVLQSENRAYLYGWAVAYKLGICIEAERWKQFNYV